MIYFSLVGLTDLSPLESLCLFFCLDLYILVLTRGEHEFRACWPLILGVSWTFRSSSLAFSFLVFGSWALLVRALLALVVASSGPGGFRPCKLWLASCGWQGILKGVSWEGLCGRLRIEDILLNERDGRV